MGSKGLAQYLPLAIGMPTRSSQNRSQGVPGSLLPTTPLPKLNIHLPHTAIDPLKHYQIRPRPSSLPVRLVSPWDQRKNSSHQKCSTSTGGSVRDTEAREIACRNQRKRSKVVCRRICDQTDKVRGRLGEIGESDLAVLTQNHLMCHKKPDICFRWDNNTWCAYRSVDV